jgi:hypothetical protein
MVPLKCPPKAPTDRKEELKLAEVGTESLSRPETCFVFLFLASGDIFLAYAGVSTQN